MKTESLRLPPILLVSVCHPYLRKQIERRKNWRQGQEVFLDSLQQGLGLARGSDLDKLGDSVIDHQSTPHQCLLPASPCAGSLTPRAV